MICDILLMKGVDKNMMEKELDRLISNYDYYGKSRDVEAIRKELERKDKEIERYKALSVDLDTSKGKLLDKLNKLKMLVNDLFLTSGGYVTYISRNTNKIKLMRAILNRVDTE